MSQLNRPHPGEIIRDEILIQLGLSLPEAALTLDALPEALTLVVDGDQKLE